MKKAFARPLILLILLCLFVPAEAQSVNARNLMKLGRSYAEQGDWKKVIEYAELAMKEEPGYLDALYLRAFAYRELKEYTKAEDDFRMVIRSDPTFLPTYGALAEMFLTQKEYDKADKVFIDLSKQPRGSNWASYYRGVVAYLRHDLTKAESHWKDVLSMDSGFTMAQHNLGALYLARGEYRRAFTYLLEAVEQKPEHLMYRFHLAWVQDKLERKDQAKENLKKIVNGEATDQKNWLLARALLRMMEGKHEEALKVLQTVSEQNPDNLDVWVLLGRAHLAQGQTEEARKALLTAQEVDPEFGEVKDLLAGLPEAPAPTPSPSPEPVSPTPSPSPEPAPEG